LMVGRHQGIASLGFFMAIGTGLCLLSALMVLPALLIVLNRRAVEDPPEVHVPITLPALPARGMRPSETLFASVEYKN
jgi:hypothetical protein